MRPIRLVIEGLRSFRAPVTIDFGDRDHIAIIGDTGAGKSSILEAITYALYGKTTFAAQANQELMNDTSTRLRVVLRFRVAGEEWEAARTLRRAGDNTVGGVTATLQRLDADGEAVEIVEQVTPVNDRIKELIGLDRDAFLRTVVLPQGRFARLLVEDSPADRSVILRQVWRTDEMEEVGRLAHQARETILETRVRLEEKAKLYPASPAAHLDELQDKSNQANAAAQAASEIEARVSESADDLEQAKARGRLALRVIEDLTRPAVSLETLEPIAAKAEEIDQQEIRLTANQDALTESLSRVPADDDGPTIAEVETAIAQLDSLLELLVSDAETKAAELRKSREEAQKKIAAAARLARAAEDAREKVNEHGRDRDRLVDEVETAQCRREAVAARWDTCSASGEALDGVSGNLTDLQAREGELETHYENALDECNLLERALSLADDHLTLARKVNLVAAASQGLHPGGDCPICSRPLDPDWVAPASGDLDEAMAAFENAKRQARDARTQATRLEGQRQSLGAHIKEAEADVQSAEKSHEAALSELARMVDVEVETDLPERPELLAPFDTAAAAADTALTAHDDNGQQLDQERQRLETEARVAEESSGNAVDAATTANRKAAQALVRVAGAVQAVPETFKPDLSLPEDPLHLVSVEAADIEARRTAAISRRTVLADRASERQRLQGELSPVQAALAELRGRRQREVDSPTADVVRQVNDYRDALLQAQSQLELNEEMPGALNTQAIDAVAARIADQLNWATRLVTKAKAISRDAREAEAAAREGLKGLGEHLGVEIDAVEEITARAREAATEAELRRRRAKEELDSFDAIKGDVEELLVLVREVGSRERAFTDLENALKPGAFMKWLTQRRSRSLLLYASRTLEQMTGGRYAFADPDDVEDRWRIFDNESGQVRSPDSLSGGEQFIASLALAIGMVEMMARGGGRLESLFLDEGFGALDRSNLDAALEALTTAVTGGRMLGVISHVRAVAEQFDQVLAVTRGVSGSDVEWLTDQQRDQLADFETPSALSGMLE
ncbi:MAG: SMC family ATPase [Gammaproteobacteria bacterium]|nr:SMC family ATPase [Gammaproteobacteria bacterium]